MIVAYVCVYSSTRSSKRSSIEKETRKPFALASTKAFVLRSARKGRFPPSFRFTFIHENHPSDIIAQKCFPSLPLLSSFLRPARTRYEILFPSFSLCFPFSAFFASKRFALRRFVVAVFLSLSLSRGIPGGKSMDRHRAIFHASPLPLLFRARLFARETAEDFSFSRLFSFLDEMKRRAMISSHRLPLLPGRRRAKDRFGVSGKKYSRSSLSLSLSLSLFSSSSIARRTQNRTPRRRLSRRTTTTRSRRTRRCWRRPSPPSLLPAPRWRTTSKTCTPPPTPRAETVLASDRRKDKRLTLIFQESKLRRSRSS